MALLSVNLIGNRDLAGRFRSVLSDQREALKRANRNAARNVKRRWAAGTRSKRIARSIQTRTESPTRVRVFVDAARVGFDPRHEEYDTRPHQIVPRNKSVLRFEAGSGEVVFTRRVRHPGTRGSRAMRRALEGAQPAYRRALQRVWGD